VHRAIVRFTVNIAPFEDRADALGCTVLARFESSQRCFDRRTYFARDFTGAGSGVKRIPGAAAPTRVRILRQAVQQAPKDRKRALAISSATVLFRQMCIAAFMTALIATQSTRRTAERCENRGIGHFRERPRRQRDFRATHSASDVHTVGHYNA